MDILVNIDVDDLDKAVAFYERALGLRLGRRLFDGSVAEMLGAPAPIYLVARPERNYARHWTPVHLDFAVEDIAAAVQRAVTAGAKLERPIEAFPWGKLAVLGDPFGHGFCLVELPQKETLYPCSE